jgi:hypothetical protein
MKSKNATSVKIISIVCVAVAIGIFSLHGFIPNTNDIYVNRFAKQLFQLSEPESGLIIEHHKLIGKLNGNGNGMDFAAIILLQTNLNTTKDDLIKYYSSFDFAPAKKDSDFGERIAGNDHRHSVDLIVEEVESAGLKRYFSNISLTFESTMNHEKYRYYAVIIYDGGYVAFLDLRGN